MLFVVVGLFGGWVLFLVVGFGVVVLLGFFFFFLGGGGGGECLFVLFQFRKI